MTLLQFISKENFVKVKPAVAASKTGHLHSFKSIIQNFRNGTFRSRVEDSYQCRLIIFSNCHMIFSNL